MGAESTVEVAAYLVRSNAQFPAPLLPPAESVQWIGSKVELLLGMPIAHSLSPPPAPPAYPAPCADPLTPPPPNPPTS